MLACGLLLAAFSAPARAAEPVTTGQLAERVGALISVSADAWGTRQGPDGRFNDPVRGNLATYGSPMLAQALIERGLERTDRRLVDQGIAALRAQIANPDNGGFNVSFEVLGLVDAWSRDQQLLAGDPAWQALSGDLKTFIERRFTRGTSVARKNKRWLSRCMNDVACFYNLKLVAAVAGIELRRAGLQARSAATTRKSDATARAAFRFATPLGSSTARTGADAALIEQAAKLTSSDARQSSWQGTALGLLSDPPSERADNPLAYNALCAMLLGRALETAPPKTLSSRVEKAFQRLTRGLLAWLAPDGESSYIGRGQGQVWVTASALTALVTAAERTPDATFRTRFLAASLRLVEHLETTYAPSASLGLALVPAHRGKTSFGKHYTGIDSYATYTMYEGLALYALRHAREVLTRLDAEPPILDGARPSGVFLDPSQARFATFRRGGLWYAVHGGDALPDLRHDFGVVAMQSSEEGRWISRLPHRPLSERPLSGGGVIRRGKHTLVPLARKLVRRKGGVIALYGGWAVPGSGRATLDRRTRWLFTPVARGVRTEFVARSSQRISFTVWCEPGSKVTRSSRGIAFRTPDGRLQRYSFNRPVTLHKNRFSEHSAYEGRLTSWQVAVRTRRGAKLRMTTSF